MQVQELRCCFRILDIDFSACILEKEVVHGSQYTRMEVIQRLRQEILRRRPVVVAGAGIGLTAKCAELGGADLIVIYNSGLFPLCMATGPSAGTMPFGDANQIVLDMGIRSILQ